MGSAAAVTFPHDRVCEWDDELQRIARELPALSPGARRAVGNVVISILREDDGIEPDATQARRLRAFLAAL